jgi:hypothetical protein
MKPIQTKTIQIKNKIRDTLLYKGLGQVTLTQQNLNFINHITR